MPKRIQLSPYKAHCEKWKDGCGAEECSRARNVVQARGKIPADVVFIAEAPGVTEDILGIPLKGPAGELLQRIIDDSVPADVRYCLMNVVGCLPTDSDGDKSGEPTDEQVRQCKPRTVELFELIKPKLIVCVGVVARTWTDTKYLHCVINRPEIPRIEIIHPAAILRSTIAVRGLQIQTAVVKIANAIEKMDDMRQEIVAKMTTRALGYDYEKDIPF